MQWTVTEIVKYAQNLESSPIFYEKFLKVEPVGRIMAAIVDCESECKRLRKAKMDAYSVGDAQQAECAALNGAGIDREPTVSHLRALSRNAERNRASGQGFIDLISVLENIATEALA